MAFARTCFVPVFGIAALFSGALESVFSDRVAVGIGRSQPCDTDTAVLDNWGDAGANDTDDEPHDRDWLPCGPLSPGVRRACVVHVLDAPADIVALRRPRAAALIRGPPARG